MKAIYYSAALIVAFLMGGAFYSTSTVTATTITVQAPAAVLARIAQCESHNHQLNPAGQVLLNVNTNGTVDIGRYQINSAHEAQATALGDNLFTDSGNTAYAQYLYANEGTGAWSSSAKCWQ